MFEGRHGRVRMALLIVAGLIGLVLLGSGNPITGGVAARLELGRRPGPTHYFATYGWSVLVVALAYVGALAATVPRWLGSEEARSYGTLPQLDSRTRLGATVVLAALLFGAAAGAPRLSQSFWDDEAYNVQNTMVGRWQVHPKTREAHYERVRWSDVLFGYVVPNNHVPHSVLGRIAHKLGDVAAPREDGAVTEWIVRIPSFLAGMLGTAALAWFLWRFGFGWAALLGPWLLVLHPWILRYTSEARGYSLAMLLGSLLLGIAAGVLQRGSWRRWIAYGVTQFLLMWTFVPTVYLVATLNLGVLARLRQRRHEGQGGEQLARFALANVASALAWLTFMLPNLAQLIDYLGVDKGKVWIHAGFVQDLFGHVIAGMPFRHGGAPDFPELGAVWDAQPVLLGGWIAVLLAAFVAGAIRCLRAEGPARDLGWVLWLPAPLAFLQLWTTNDRAYVWYFIVFLPSALALVAIGATWIAEASWRGARAAAIGVAVVLLAGAVWSGGPARDTLRARSFFPMREAALATRPSLDMSSPANREIITVSWSGPPRYYDALHHYTPEPKSFRALLREADRTGRPLFVNLGRLGIAARRAPENLAMVRDPRWFEEVAEFQGFTPTRSRVVYRYRGGWSPESSGDATSIDPGR